LAGSLSTGSLSTCEHGARVHDSERSHHQLKLSPRHRQQLNNDFDQVELDGIRVPSALRKEWAEAKRREDVVHGETGRSKSAPDDEEQGAEHVQSKHALGSCSGPTA
jgi:hypothetical protein